MTRPGTVVPTDEPEPGKDHDVLLSLRERFVLGVGLAMVVAGLGVGGCISPPTGQPGATLIVDRAETVYPAVDCPFLFGGPASE